jgi:hypothetical protein
MTVRLLSLFPPAPIGCTNDFGGSGPENYLISESTFGLKTDFAGSNSRACRFAALN